MANTPSSEKRNRQTQKRHDRNVAVRSSVKTAVKKLREALDNGDTAAAKKALPVAEKALASAASKGVLHKNAASRRISRLAHAVSKTAAAK